MPWRELVVEVDAAVADALGDALLAHGARSVTVEDAAAGTADEQPVFDEPNTDSTRVWARARIRALLAAEADPQRTLAVAVSKARLHSVPRCAVGEVGDEDWVRASQAQFEPIRVSARLWIVPSWRTPPDPDALVIRLDPGLAFGTGSHATTRLCLRWLEQWVRPGSSVLDYGCGSGILTIAALKLGARAAVGLDVDPVAVAQARENAARNAVAANFVLADAPLPSSSDLVVANILANPLKVLAPVLAAHCRRGGRIALAGILAAQADAVIAAYAEWFEVAAFGAEDGWVGLEGPRR